MAKQLQNSNDLDGRFEFRVWGSLPKVRRQLEEMASEESREKLEDCYLLVEDLDWNAKVRDDTLKVKQLVGSSRGFDCWTAAWHRDAESTPSPFDDVFEDLSLDRPQRGKKYSLERAVSGLDENTRAIFVTKDRRRYVIGSMKAEYTRIDIPDTGTKLETIAIEGANLKDLVALRRSLGLEGHPNVPMHVVLDGAAA